MISFFYFFIFLQVSRLSGGFRLPEHCHHAFRSKNSGQDPAGRASIMQQGKRDEIIDILAIMVLEVTLP